VKLLRDPKSDWQTPAITTHGFKNHAVRTEHWRYIRYKNGDEELYDTAADPFEYVNLAGSPAHSERIAELKGWLPKFDAPNLPERRSRENVLSRSVRQLRMDRRANKKRPADSKQKRDTVESARSNDK
jgi:hypothetical protein